MRFDEPPICGGTTRSTDQKAPKEILSKDLVFFSVGSTDERFTARYEQGAVSVYAAKTTKGIYAAILGIETRYKFFAPDCNLMARLDALTRQQKLILDNGHHSFTHGLPADFGGAVNIRYASGEYISKSDNQSPVITNAANLAIKKLFEEAFKSYPEAPLPDPASIQAIEYHESGPFAEHFLRMEKTAECAVLRSDDAYDGGKSKYHKDAQAPLSAFDRIEADALTFRVFGQGGLTQYHPSNDSDKRFLTYEFADGTRLDVPRIFGIPGKASDIVYETYSYLDSLMK